MTLSANQWLPADVQEALTGRPARALTSGPYVALLQGELPPARAAVLCALVDGREGLDVIFTRRVDHLRHHAGQVSFPGGRVDDDDADEEATALREAHEEIGLPPASVTVLGRLHEHPTITGFRVTPVVAHIESGVTLTPNPAEVADVFQVPLHWLLDDANVSRATREYRGRRIVVHRFDWNEHVIWGATASMILDLKKILLGA